MPDSDVCTEVLLTPPAFVSTTLYSYCKDLEHGSKGELSEISPETQALLANILRGLVDPTDPTYGKPFTPSIPIPIGLLDLPGDLTLKIWPKNLKDLSEGTNGVLLNYEVLRW